MKSEFVTILCLVGLVGFTQAVDYCAKALCGDSKHIACNNTGAFSSSCPSDRREIVMNSTLQIAIVKRHNELRNSIAGGNMTKFKPCVRMATMQWDSELASLALLNAKTCVFAHDACHNTAKYLYSGQNIEQKWTSGTFDGSVVSNIVPGVDSWWSENKDTTMDDINKYPRSPKAVIGHFTVMTVQANDRVGCGAVAFKDPKQQNWNSILFVCNYARTNILDGQSYESGTVASKCDPKTKTNPNFKNLCSINEKY